MDFPGCTDLDAHATSVLVLPDPEAPSAAARAGRTRHRATATDHQRTTHRQPHVRHQTQSQLQGHLLRTKVSANRDHLNNVVLSLFNKKVLLRERKGHAARRVVSTPSVVLTGYPPPPGMVPPPS